MKKLISIFTAWVVLGLIFPWYFFAGFGYTVVGGGTVAASGCNPATDEIGYRASDPASMTLQFVDLTYMRGNLWTPECSGPLNTAYAWNDSGTSGRVVKILVYENNGTDADKLDTGDTLRDYTGEISADAAEEWFSGAMTNNYNVSTANKYWVVMISDQMWGYVYESGANCCYAAIDQDDYDTPPTNPPVTQAGYNDRKVAVYVTIGN